MEIANLHQVPQSTHVPKLRELPLTTKARGELERVIKLSNSSKRVADPTADPSAKHHCGTSAGVRS